jgi:hypothetical protein
MTMPPDSTSPDGYATILVEIGKLQTQVAVMDERLKEVPGLMQRMREVELAQAQASGYRDNTARVGAGIGGLIAIGSALVQYLHH